jgi:hypothetical protein
MAKQALRGSWGSPRSKAVAEQVERIRSERPGRGWTQPVGVLLMVLAFALAVDPDYPLAWSRSARGSVSAGKGGYLLPRALTPKGPICDRRLRFCWQWQGPDVAWDVVLLDAALDEVARMAGIHGLEVMADESLSAAVASGGTFFWYAEGHLDGRPFRCPPVGFTRQP